MDRLNKDRLKDRPSNLIHIQRRAPVNNNNNRHNRAILPMPGSRDILQRKPGLRNTGMPIKCPCSKAARAGAQSPR